MDVNKVFIKLKELGHANSRREELREYCKLKLDQILKLLPRRIVSSDGADILDCLFNGIPDNPTASLKHKVKIVDIVLQTMRKESTSLSHCGDVISRLCLELPRMPVDDLVRWCNDSVQSIVDDGDVNMIWRDVLPECLTGLSSQSTIKHCGTELTVSAYKEQCVHTLCQCRWREKQLVQLAAMFKDMQLARNDHKQAVNKLCSYIIDVPPDTLPPFVHQLLKLCKAYHVEIVLGHLSRYFGVRLYSKLEPPPQDSESTTMDIDDIVPHSAAELSRCLSTCLYHITQGAAEPEVIRRHLKLWPKTQLLRAPFLLDVALALSDKGADFKTVCLDVIKSAIELRIQDELRSRESSWVRSALPPAVDVASVLKVLTTESANHRELTVMGLINLAFCLLSVSRAKPAAPSCWSHAKLILVRLCKSQPETAPHILSLLADRLAGECQLKQYADCLHVLCKLTPVSLERCSQLGAVLESCQPSARGYGAAAAVLDAVHPLLNFSTRTRDTLVMTCRKGLYSRDTLHRCLALSGFLSVLRHVRLNTSTLSGSQPGASELSAHSYLTQICVDLHATQRGAVTSRVRNEAMCLEVISILRRCLVQDATVKQLLYTKIYDCVKEKTALHDVILEMLYDQLSKYLPDDGEGPLKWEKCIQINATSALLVEPIAHLLYVIAEFLQPVEEELEDILGSQSGEPSAVFLKTKLMNLLDKQDIFTSGIDMEDLGLSDITPESRSKALKVQQILQCYEALIAHRVMQWSPTSTNAANKVYSLYKAHSQLLEQAKTTPKSTKKGNKTLNETKETQKTQKSQKSQKDKGKTPAKLSNMVKDRAGPFKPLPCVWDLTVCQRVIQLLYSSDVPWSSAQQRDHIRGRPDFHQWALRAALSATSPELVDRRSACRLLPVAAGMYRCLCRYRDMCTFDDQTMLGCLDLFKACLNLLLSPDYSLRLESFLPAITGMSESTPASCVAVILNKIHEALELASEESLEDENDAGLKKSVAALGQVAEVLLMIPGLYSSEISAAIIKLEDYIRTSKQDCLSMVPALLAASYRSQQEATFLDELFTKLSSCLGRIDEDDTSAGGEETPDFPSIDSKTGHTVLSYICSHLTARLKCVEHLILRAKDLSTVTDNQQVDRELKELYKSCIVQLCQLGAWTTRACKLRCSVGGGSERVLGAALRLYAALGALARGLSAEAAVLLRFERLLKLCGKKLSTVTDNLITYLEASQQQQTASKVLRDTKLIPRLVLQCEQFSKHVILLANKGKLNYQQYLSLGTARDFRIKAPVLQEALHARDHRLDDTSDHEEQNNINDAETEILGRRSGSEASDDEEDKRKRRRVS